MIERETVLFPVSGGFERCLVATPPRLSAPRKRNNLNSDAISVLGTYTELAHGRLEFQKKGERATAD